MSLINIPSVRAVNCIGVQGVIYAMCFMAVSCSYSKCNLCQMFHGCFCSGNDRERVGEARDELMRMLDCVSWQ